MPNLPKFLESLIDNPPAAGSGVHLWLFNVSRNLHAHMPAGQIEDLLRSRLANCGRKVPDREIKEAIKHSIDAAWTPKGSAGAVRESTAAQPDPDLIERLVVDGYRIADLWHNSPCWFESPQTEAIIDLLFPGNPLLCCGKTAFEFDTKTREEWSGQLSQLSFIVPSTMTARTGLTQNGKHSAHALSNTGPRRFLIVEYDFAEFAKDGKTPTQWQPMLQRLAKLGITIQDMCANLLLRLNNVKPMTMAVCSGGKSIHGWWYCNGATDAQLKPFHQWAVVRGADPATFRPSQFVRIPDGRRDNGKEQSVLYFDPSTLPRL